MVNKAIRLIITVGKGLLLVLWIAYCYWFYPQLHVDPAMNQGLKDITFHYKKCSWSMLICGSVMVRIGRVSIKVTAGWFWGDSYWGYPALVHKPGPSCGSHLGRFSAAKDLHVHAKGQLLQSLFSPQIQMLRARMPQPVLAPFSHPLGTNPSQRFCPIS